VTDHDTEALCPQGIGVAHDAALAGTSPAIETLRSAVRALAHSDVGVLVHTSVHHRRTSLDFAMRPPIASTGDRRGISRFPFAV
jgi:hypothetical protein